MLSEKLKVQLVLRETTMMFPQLRCVLAVLFLVLIALSQNITRAAAQTCPKDGDVNQNGNLTPADALLAFRHFLGIAEPSLTDCQQSQANVRQPVSSAITTADALCILQQFLGLPSCFPAQFVFPDGEVIRSLPNASILLTVGIVNASGLPVPEAQVIFLITEDTPGPEQMPVLTGNDGRASINLTVGPEGNKVQANVAGLVPLTLTIMKVDREDVRPPIVEVMGNTQSAPPGTVLNVPLVVRMVDATGNPVAGVEVTVMVEGEGAEVTELPEASAQLSGLTRLPAQIESTTAIAVTNAQGEARFVVRGEVGDENIIRQTSRCWTGW